ncbi:MAG: hypoxanthine phosphoribosyltransferase [Duncaniella sp.]|nr:hypoxanthine phosphoribosyltransferase [Duncaniella sp.]HBI58011.1 hypoxanthine phosphoribosyltransferase [Porphyromonadaceae bacterium]
MDTPNCTKLKTYQGLTFEPYIESDKIKERVAEIGAQITRDCEGTVPLFVCVLNGAFPFASDLIRAVDCDAEITFIRLKSYEGMGSTGKVKEVMGLTENIEGRTIILVEDIIDTGNTIVKLIDDMKAHNPARIKVATLLFKEDALQHKVEPDYVGFNIPTKFIIGYGLDLDGMARNLPDIYVLSEKDKDKEDV